MELQAHHYNHHSNLVQAKATPIQISSDHSILAISK